MVKFEFRLTLYTQIDIFPCNILKCDQRKYFKAMGNGLSKPGHGNSRRTKKSVVKKKVLNHQDEGSEEISLDEPIEVW